VLHFAYGSNMDRSIMRKHAPCAEPIGVASLAGHRFIITADGYASIEPARECGVHGVLWRLTPRDRVTLDAWENVAAGQYRATTLTVSCGGRRRPALVYMARPRRTGWPKNGYMELVLAAARAWQLPSAYIASLQRWLPAQARAGGTRRLKELEWT
jgi:hypothetical protein